MNAQQAISVRRVLLRVMLASLALAAGAGVLGVLVPGRDVVWRLVGTTFATGATCALLFSVTRFIEKAEMQLASLAGVTLVLIEYLLCLLLIWNVPESLISRDASEATGMTMLYLTAVGIPVMALLRMLTHPTARFAARVGLVLLAGAFITMMFGVWLPGRVWRHGDLIGAAFCAEIYSFAIIACLVGILTSNQPRVQWIGVGCALLGAILVIGGIFSHSDSKLFLHIATWSSILATIIAFANVIYRAELTGGARYLRSATLLAFIGTAIVVGIQVTFDDHDEMISRLGAAGGICTGCGAVAMAIITRINKKTKREMVAPADITTMDVVCPGCQKKQTVALGESACYECGLRFSIKVDEPRCETCGYLLYHLKSDRCPECGTAIPWPGRGLSGEGDRPQMADSLAMGDNLPKMG